MSEQVMNYPRCKTCKWWGADTHLDPAIDLESRYCAKAFSWNKEWPYQPDGDEVRYADVDEPPTVPPDFGCIHHETKEASNGDV